MGLRWYGERILKELFPSLYILAQMKDVAVADLIRWSANQIQWDVIFYKALHDWEQGLMEDFYP